MDGGVVPPIAGKPDPRDMQRYRDALRRDVQKLTAELSPKFHSREFILVRGFLTDALDGVGLMMKDQVKALTALGCKVRKVRDGFDSEKPPAVNASAIAKAVATATSKVVLVTHSKGSVDTLTALVKEPGMRDRVSGWISIQGAVQGSPVADFLAAESDNYILDATKRAALSTAFDLLFKGSIAALDELRTSDRVAFVRDPRNEAEIAKIAAEIPIVSFGSAAPKTRSTLRQITDPFFDGDPNDGLVSLDRTVIPEARTIIHDDDGPDHADAVMDVPGEQDWDRIRLTYALLSLLP